MRLAKRGVRITAPFKNCTRRILTSVESTSNYRISSRSDVWSVVMLTKSKAPCCSLAAIVATSSPTAKLVHYQVFYPNPLRISSHLVIGSRYSCSPRCCQALTCSSRYYFLTPTWLSNLILPSLGFVVSHLGYENPRVYRSANIG